MVVGMEGAGKVVGDLVVEDLVAVVREVVREVVKVEVTVAVVMVAAAMVLRMTSMTRWPLKLKSHSHSSLPQVLSCRTPQQLAVLQVHLS